eukprot:750196-Hanusia_phi.AAC.7
MLTYEKRSTGEIDFVDKSDGGEGPSIQDREEPEQQPDNANGRKIDRRQEEVEVETENGQGGSRGEHAGDCGRTDREGEELGEELGEDKGIGAMLSGITQPTPTPHMRSGDLESPVFLIINDTPTPITPTRHI